jgi:3-hydroxybutyryl-CoA dehydrogenase
MKGVEIITGLQTSEDTLQQTLSFAEKLGKVPSRSVDSPGFLANRLLMPYVNEAIICLETVYIDQRVWSNLRGWARRRTLTIS